MPYASQEYDQIPLTDISVPKDRQRKELKDIEELAVSIQRYGLLHPIIISREKVLLAGERRYRAFTALEMQTIPCHYIDNVTPEVAKAIELEENVKRQNLTWQERVMAEAEYHKFCMGAEDNWSQEKTAEALNVVVSTVNNSIQIASKLRSGDKRILTAKGKRAAYNIVKRDRARQSETEISQLAVNVVAGSKGKLEIAPEISVPKKKKEELFEILQGDFRDWAPAYKGKKFNFLHCDFPYGIEHGTSDQGGAVRHGTYLDSEDVYWELLETLSDNLDRLLYSSAHVMFWFSMNYYAETLKFFQEETDLLLVQPHPLIWFKSDNRGIVADVQRRPRHVYETALLLSRGDRKLIQPLADCYAAPTYKATQSIHLSEKSEPMLKHFFRMTVDGLTEILDPTCGGGSAIRAALEHGAKRSLGLELNPEYVEIANTRTRTAQNLASLSEGVGK